MFTIYIYILPWGRYLCIVAALLGEQKILLNVYNIYKPWGRYLCIVATLLGEQKALLNVYNIYITLR